MFGTRYNDNSVTSLLVSANPNYYKTPKRAAKFVKGGCIGLMKSVGESLITQIKDPNYIPKTGEVFGLAGPMFDTDEWYTMTDNGLVISESYLEGAK